MNITLFGGSFNPPHLGHLIVVQQALELIPNVDEIWLLPDYQHSFSKNENLAPVKHRLNMTKMLETKHVRTETCTIDHQMSGNTIDHITYLTKRNPNHDFSFLMGSDNLKTFHKWPRHKELIQLMPFYIYPRAGYSFKSLYHNMHPLKHPLQVITNLSSTLIRNRIKKNLPTSRLTTQPIHKYITTHHLYY